ncbi:MAG: hypothetical protein IKW96_04965 [Ruminococcus sp.]|nr:hypothetical protein [Ruminococcus sp.]
MDDIMNKIGDLLSDEESVKQLSELAQMLVSEDNSSETNSNGANLPDIDISSVMKLTSLIGEASRQDKNTDLLLALRPHLGVEKQKRVDKALKLLKLLAVWNMIKDSGMLQDLI